MMQLSQEKIETLKKALPELYEFVLNVTSLLEGDLSYIKGIPQHEVDKLNKNDPAALNTDLRLALIQDRVNAVLDKFKQSIKNCKISLGLDSKASIADILLSKEFNDNLTFNEKFIASAVATAISKVNYD